MKRTTNTAVTTAPARTVGPRPLGRRTPRRLGTGLLSATAAAALLLTGCTGEGADAGRTTSDEGAKGRGPGLGAPAPAPDGSQAEGDTGKGEDTGKKKPSNLSTFALDVDTASYGYARRTLKDGSLPAPDSVRPEEFVNSFRHDYPQPKGDGFSVTMDGARADGDWSLLRIGLATREVPARSRPPAALTFVVDVSGSMASPGRLDLVRDALVSATRGLRDDDSLALVTFSDEAETVLPMTRLDGNRERIRAAVEELEPASSTDLGAGVRTGYDTAAEGRRKGATNRVVLLSDALANSGDTESEEILERVEDERKEHGITLFGVGVGSEYGDALMEELADKGDGHTTYVSERDEARALFTEELPANVGLRARDAKAQVAFDPEKVSDFRLVGYDNRRVADEDFRDDSVDGGEIGPGHTVTALYAVKLRKGAEGKVATTTVRWQEPEKRTPHENTGAVDAEALTGGLDRAGADLRTTVFAAWFADALRSRDDRYTALPGSPGLPQLARDTRELARKGRDPQATELAEAVRRAERLRAGAGAGAGSGSERPGTELGG